MHFIYSFTNFSWVSERAQIELRKLVNKVCCRAAYLVWSRPSSVCVFLSPLMMASFLADGRSRNFYGSPLRGGYITGTPLIKAGAGLGFHVVLSPSLFFPSVVSFSISPLLLSCLSEKVFRAHQKAHPSSIEMAQQNRSLFVCWKSPTATCAMIAAVLYKQQSHCRLFTHKPVMRLPATLWQSFLLRPHTVLIPHNPRPSLQVLPAQPNMICEITPSEGGNFTFFSSQAGAKEGMESHYVGAS